MIYHPSRLLGIALGVIWIGLLSAASAFGIWKLTSAGISTITILWIFLPLLGFLGSLLVGYRLFGLISASYRLDRDGFAMRWGLAREQIPLSEIRAAVVGNELSTNIRPTLGLWWPGCVVGKQTVDQLGEVEFFSSNLGDGLVLLTLTNGGALAISPSNAVNFQQAFIDATRLGSLERLARESTRPDFVFAHLWEDRLARALILAGLLISIALLGFLSAVGPNLPSQVPFGFDPLGFPDPLAPPGRLLLLPLVGGLIWLIDLIVGLLTYRTTANRVVAYAVWASSIATAILLWGGAVHLVAAIE
jgi:hypothetical protein